MYRSGGEARPSMYRLIGAACLYSSAYFLDYSGEDAYLLPSGGLFRVLVLPSIFAVAVLFACGLIVLAFGSRWVSARLGIAFQVVFVSFLMLIAMKGCMTLVGYDWEDKLPRGRDLATAQRYLKVGVFVATLIVIWFARGVLPRLYRLLSSLGYAFALLAVMRVCFIAHDDSLLGNAADTSLAVGAVPSAAGISARRVVWVIFDETDFLRAFHGDGNERVELKNFDALARVAVFATRASSPASATGYSIPALLANKQLGGRGVSIRGQTLFIETADGKSAAFGETASIFGENSRNGRTSSILGFFHPYCRLFSVQRCDSFPWPDVGTLSAALWSNVPKVISTRLGHPDPWQEITRRMLELLPDYLRRKDALTFIHLNFPHPPATYADEDLRLVPSVNPLIEYSHNLLFADKVLAKIIGEVEKQAPTQQVLLVVSSDHWLRNMWFKMGVPDSSRPIPFIVWKVGESKGIVMSEPLNTGHTADMILDYLDGRISSQDDVAAWWAHQSFYPSFLVPGT